MLENILLLSISLLKELTQKTNPYYSIKFHSVPEGKYFIHKLSNLNFS